MPSLAEDLMLLLLDDESGRSVIGGTYRDQAVAGAVLLDLVRLGRLAPTEDEPRKGRLVVTDDSPTGDPVLDVALPKLARKPVRTDAAVRLLAGSCTEGVLDRLVDRGLVRREETRVLGLFPVKSWPAVDAAHEAELRERLDATVLRDAEPDERVGCLVALLHVTGAITKVVAGDKARVRARAKEIAKGNWAADAVKKAIDSVTVAVIAATTATVTVTATS